MFRASDRLEHDSRMKRECKTLERAGYSVIVVAMKPRGQENLQVIPGVEVVEIEVSLRASLPSRVLVGAKYGEYVLKAIRYGLRSGASVFHCHDLPTLPIGYYLSRRLGTRLVYDARELWLGLEMSGAQWAIWSIIERKMIHDADIVISTDKYRENWLQKRYGISNTVAIRNVPDLEATRIEEDVCLREGLRASLGLPNNAILGVYFGGIYSRRHVHDIVACAALLPDHIHIALVGSGAPEYINKIRGIVDMHKLHKRVHLLPPVPSEMLISFVSTADFSFVLYDDKSLNNKLCSPNKLFESIAAGLPIMATANPLLKDIVAENRIGVCIESPVTPENLATGVIDLLSMNMNAMRETIHRIGGTYVWENESTKLIAAYNALELSFMNSAQLLCSECVR